MFSVNGARLVAMVASKCDMNNWAGLVDVGNVIYKGRPIDEDSSEEPIDGSDRVALEGGASWDKTRTIK